MKNRLMMLLLAVACAIPAVAGEGHVRRSGKPVPGEYIVVLNDDARGRSEIAADLSHRFGTRTKTIFAGFHGFVVYGTEQSAQAVSRDPRVAWIEENTYVEWTQAANTTTRPFPPGWAIDRTDQAAGLDGYGGPGCNNAIGIRIYVVDTGIDNTNGEFGSRLRFLWKALSSWPNDDTRGHGTAVASLAAGSQHGLARGAEVVSVKIQNGLTSSSTADFVISAVGRIDVDHYKLNLNNPAPKPAVVNMSIYLPRGSVWPDTKLSAVDTAVMKSIKGCTGTTINPTTGIEECTSFNQYEPAAYGLTYVVGAGNNGTPINGTPARLGDDQYGTITVGATMMRDEWTTDWRAIWDTVGSNYGPEVDIWAPGTDVDILRHQEDPNLPSGITRQDSGTSLATPLVAGQVARLAATYTWYTSAQLEEALKIAGTTTDPFTGLSIIRDVPGGIHMRYTPGKCRM